MRDTFLLEVAIADLKTAQAQYRIQIQDLQSRVKYANEIIADLERLRKEGQNES